MSSKNNFGLNQVDNVKSFSDLPNDGIVLFYFENKTSYKCKRLFADCSNYCPGINFYGFNISNVDLSDFIFREEFSDINPIVILYKESEPVDFFKCDDTLCVNELIEWCLTVTNYTK